MYDTRSRRPATVYQTFYASSLLSLSQQRHLQQVRRQLENVLLFGAVSALWGFVLLMAFDTVVR